MNELTTDFIANGVMHGDVGDKLSRCNWDPGVLRPWSHQTKKKGLKSFVTVRGGTDDNGEVIYRNVPIANALATLPKDVWIRIDETITRVARQRLRLVGMLNGAGLSYTVPNGMGTTVLQHQSMSDGSPAQTDMDAVADELNDRPLFNLESLPLPITHKGFFFTQRELAVSRAGGAPLDLTMAEQAGRFIAEQIEKLTIGTAAGYTYGGGSVYGLINYPFRQTQVITAPSAGGWTPLVTLTEVIAMMKKANDVSRFGPYALLLGNNWMPYLELDYSTLKGENTLRARLMALDDLQSITRLDYLNRANFDIILVQLQSDTVQMVNGMDITTVQWDSHGGMKKNFKVLTIQVPRIRRDFNGSGGIVHGASV